MSSEFGEGVKPIEIAQLKPSHISTDDYELLGLDELMSLGYGIPREDGLKRAEEEYGGSDERKDIFFALEQGRIVSSLVLINWSEGQTKRGAPFWGKLRELDHKLVDKAQEYSSYACDVGGIVTLPEYRSKGIMKKLIQKAHQELKPSIIVGRTKTVEAVKARASNWDGMQTYYGLVNITPGSNPTDSGLSQELDDAYYIARQPEEIVDKEGIIYVSSDFLPPTIPDVSQVSEAIQLAFKPVIERQKELNEIGRQTALLPLISIAKAALH